VQLKVL